MFTATKYIYLVIGIISPNYISIQLSDKPLWDVLQLIDSYTNRTIPIDSIPFIKPSSFFLQKHSPYMSCMWCAALVFECSTVNSQSLYSKFHRYNSTSCPVSEATSIYFIISKHPTPFRNQWFHTGQNNFQE